MPLVIGAAQRGTAGRADCCSVRCCIVAVWLWHGALLHCALLHRALLHRARHATRYRQQLWRVLPICSSVPGPALLTLAQLAGNCCINAQWHQYRAGPRCNKKQTMWHIRTYTRNRHLLLCCITSAGCAAEPGAAAGQDAPQALCGKCAMYRPY
jgi:hypothetical protein